MSVPVLFARSRILLLNLQTLSSNIVPSMSKRWKLQKAQTSHRYGPKDHICSSYSEQLIIRVSSWQSDRPSRSQYHLKEISLVFSRVVQRKPVSHLYRKSSLVPNTVLLSCSSFFNGMSQLIFCLIPVPKMWWCTYRMQQTLIRQRIHSYFRQAYQGIILQCCKGEWSALQSPTILSSLTPECPNCIIQNVAEFEASEHSGEHYGIQSETVGENKRY